MPLEGDAGVKLSAREHQLQVPDRGGLHRLVSWIGGKASSRSVKTDMAGIF